MQPSHLSAFIVIKMACSVKNVSRNIYRKAKPTYPTTRQRQILLDLTVFYQHKYRMKHNLIYLQAKSTSIFISYYFKLLLHSELYYKPRDIISFYLQFCMSIKLVKDSSIYIVIINQSEIIRINTNNFCKSRRDWFIINNSPRKEE